MSDDQPILNIIGERVALGPLRRDLIPLYNRWRNDFPTQRTFGELPRAVSIDEQTDIFEKRAATTEDYWFTIYEKEMLRPIGTTDLFNVDWRMRFCSFGMMIGEADARGKGYGTEVARLMLDYAFTALGLNNVMLTVSEYNLAGRRAYEKAGFKEFGKRRQADILAGVAYAEVYMDCIASDFDSPVLGQIFMPDVAR